MEKESRFGTRAHLLRLFGIALLIFAAMLLCALAGYRFVRMSGIAENQVEDAQKLVDEFNKQQKQATNE